MKHQKKHRGEKELFCYAQYYAKGAGQKTIPLGRKMITETKLYKRNN